MSKLLMFLWMTELEPMGDRNRRAQFNSKGERTLEEINAAQSCK